MLGTILPVLALRVVRAGNIFPSQAQIRVSRGVTLMSSSMKAEPGYATK